MDIPRALLDQARTMLLEIGDEGEVKSLLRILKEDLWMKSQADLATRSQHFLEAVDRIHRGEPIQYVVQSAHFFGFDFYVNPSVLIPRSETEELVQLVVESSKDFDSPAILDIGTGSGCIAIALNKKIEQARISAIDISVAALEIARENNRRLQTKVQFLQCDILDENNWQKLGKFDLIVSNPPYVLRSESHLMNTLEHEPHLALFVEDAVGVLQFYEKIARFAKEHLLSGGALLLEINQFKSQKIIECLKNYGFSVELFPDMQGNDRLIKCAREL